MFMATLWYMIFGDERSVRTLLRTRFNLSVPQDFDEEDAIERYLSSQRRERVRVRVRARDRIRRDRDDSDDYRRNLQIL